MEVSFKLHSSNATVLSKFVSLARPLPAGCCALLRRPELTTYFEAICRVDLSAIGIIRRLLPALPPGSPALAHYGT
jgi:hypothetical protein